MCHYMVRCCINPFLQMNCIGGALLNKYTLVFFMSFGSSAVVVINVGLKISTNRKELHDLELSCN
jgi:hypothetical protein